MKSFMQRAFGAIFAGLVLATLAACGGGGGSDTTPIPPPPATSALALTAATPTSVFVNNLVAVSVIVNASEPLVANATGLAPVGLISVKDAAGMTSTFNVGFKDSSRLAVNLLATLAPSKDYTATFASLAGIGGGTATIAVPFTTPAATPVVLHYTDKVFTIWGKLGKIYSVTPTSVDLLTNKTSHVNFGICAFGQKLPDGNFLTKCTDAADSKEHLISVNPTNGEQTDYVGTEPAGTVWTYTQTSGSHFPTWSSEAQTSYGTYYVEGTSTSVILLKTNAGVISVVKAGNFASDGSVGALVTVNN